MSGYIQIGVTALRDPVTGEPLEAVPLYIREEDREKAAAPSAGLMKDMAATLGAMFGKYVKEASKMKGAL